MIRRLYHSNTLLSKWEVSLAELMCECVWLCDVMAVLFVHHHRNILLRVQHSLFFGPSPAVSSSDPEMEHQHGENANTTQLQWVRSLV